MLNECVCVCAGKGKEREVCAQSGKYTSVERNQSRLSDHPLALLEMHTYMYILTNNQQRKNDTRIRYSPTSYRYTELHLYLEELGQDFRECRDSIPSLFIGRSRICKSEVPNSVTSNGMFTMCIESPSWCEKYLYVRF
jgi:hypothetical protein